ncbi:hypothetical protein ABT369_12020 [Dactylosporangium sp. NPDC000244]|uniref:hypothetical protein n=1 Tax=Dactylosporangium sp. NPDC000244 TaxID=3154365 RepID=UPI003320C75C
MSVYQHYTVRELWAMVAHESAAEHAEAMRGWAAKHSMLGAQIGNLERLRQELADAWHPEGSPAARAFLDQIDQTIVSMTGAQEAAGQAKATFSKVTGALITAQERIKPLHDAYDDPRAAWRAYLAKTPAGPMIGTLPDSWAPGIDMPDFATDAVLRLHREELDKQARAIMDDTDAKVAAATAQPVVMPKMNRLDEMPAPPTPSKPRGGSRSNGTSRSLPPPVFDPPQPNLELINASPGPATPPVTVDLGPFLTASPAPALPPVLMPPPPTAPAVSPAPAPRTPLPLPPMTSPLPGRLMPTNGLIGRPPAQPSAGRPPQGPLGEHGVIGGPGSFGRSGAIGRSARSPLRDTRHLPAAEPGAESGERLPGGGWRDRSYEAYAQRRTGRQHPEDEVWQVEEGVAPVLEAPPARPTGDVPPGVIGIDR